MMKIGKKVHVMGNGPLFLELWGWVFELKFRVLGKKWRKEWKFWSFTHIILQISFHTHQFESPQPNKNKDSIFCHFSN